MKYKVGSAYVTSGSSVCAPLPSHPQLQSERYPAQYSYFSNPYLIYNKEREASQEIGRQSGREEGESDTATVYRPRPMNGNERFKLCANIGNITNILL